jgi:dephospho-CoA kinase
MIEAQASRAVRLAAADDLIVNDREPAALGPQVAALHRQYVTGVYARVRPQAQ